MFLFRRNRERDAVPAADVSIQTRISYSSGMPRYVVDVTGKPRQVELYVNGRQWFYSGPLMNGRNEVEVVVDGQIVKKETIQIELSPFHDLPE